MRLNYSEKFLHKMPEDRESVFCKVPATGWACLPQAGLACGSLGVSVGISTGILDVR